MNTHRRAQILAELVAQFPPADIVQKAEREQLAATLERLETIVPGSTAHARLMTTAATLGAQIRGEEATRIGGPTEDLSDLSTDELLVRSRRATARLEHLIALDTAVADPPAAPAHVGGAIAEAAVAEVKPPPIAPEAQPSPVLPAPRLTSLPSPPEPSCPFCGLPLTDCESLRTTNLASWRICHGQVGKPSPS